MLISLAEAEDKWGKGRPATPVVVAIAMEQLMAPITWVTGSVSSRFEAGIAAETEGRIVFVAETGERVEKGAVIARVDSTRLSLLMKEQQARVQRAEAQRAFLQQEVKRLRRLAGQNNAARTLIERTEAEHAVAKADLALAHAQLQQSQDMIDRAVLRAPFTGVVIQRLVQAGEWAAKGRILLHMLDPLALEIQATAPLASLPFLSPGDELLVKNGRLEKKARLRTLTNAAAGAARQLALRLDFDNTDWLAGQSLRVAIPVAGQQTLIAVPRDALVLRRSGIAVFRVDAQGKAERVAVVTGIADGDLIAVSGGIGAGDKIIIRGAERLRPGQQVRITNADELP